MVSETASKREQRKIFDQMLIYVREQSVDHIVCEKVDRLTRNLKDTVLLEEWINANQAHNVHLVKNSLVLNQKSRSQDRLNWGMNLMIARFYTDNLREEVEKGISEKLAQGWLPGPPPAWIYGRYAKR